MKKCFIFAVSLFLITACNQQTKEAGSGFTAKDVNDPLLKDLPGSWRLHNLSLAALSSNEMEGNVMFQNAKTNDIQSIMVLKTDGGYFTSRDGATQFTSWEFVSPNIISLKGGTGSNDITINSLSGDTLKGSYELNSPQTGSRVAKVNATWSKMSEEDAAVWANPDLYIWKQKPTASETPEQIKARLKSLLSYNSLMAGTAAKNNATTLNTNNFQLPFKYYQGSIALKQEDPNDSFNSLFYNGTNAHAAYVQLHEAFKKVPYPKSGNYIQEYSDFMKNLAAAL